MHVSGVYACWPNNVLHLCVSDLVQAESRLQLQVGGASKGLREAIFKCHKGHHRQQWQLCCIGLQCGQTWSSLFHGRKRLGGELSGCLQSTCCYPGFPIDNLAVLCMAVSGYAVCENAIQDMLFAKVPLCMPRAMVT